MLIVSKFHQVLDRSTENSVTIVFNATIAQKLSPSARVVVWYITDGNEVITDSLDFNVEGVFTNKVRLSLLNVTAIAIDSLLRSFSSFV